MRAFAILAVALCGCKKTEEEPALPVPRPVPVARDAGNNPVGPADAAPARRAPDGIKGLDFGMKREAIAAALGAAIEEDGALSVTGVLPDVDRPIPGALEDSTARASTTELGKRYAADTEIGGQRARCTFDVLYDTGLGRIACKMANTEIDDFGKLLLATLTDKYGPPEGSAGHHRWSSPTAVLVLDEGVLEVALENRAVRLDAALDAAQSNADALRARLVNDGLAKQVEDPRGLVREQLGKDL